MNKRDQEAAEQYCRDTYATRHQSTLSPFDMIVRDFKAGASHGRKAAIAEVLEMLRSEEADSENCVDLMNDNHDWADWLESEMKKKEG